MTLDETISELRAKKNSLKCSKLKSVLEGFGFRVKRKGNAQHYVVTHPGLAKYGFLATSFGCKHGKNPDTKGNYVENICKVLNAHKEGLKELGYD